MLQSLPPFSDQVPSLTVFSSAFLVPKVLLMDGFHRIRALVIIGQHPEMLLAAELGIEWGPIAERFPQWVQITKNGKVQSPLIPLMTTFTCLQM
jgi:hypothetical protein